eukprot:4855939-Pyramimonas_sp.AAC.1
MPKPSNLNAWFWLAHGCHIQAQAVRLGTPRSDNIPKRKESIESGCLPQNPSVCAERRRQSERHLQCE